MPRRKNQGTELSYQTWKLKRLQKNGRVFFAHIASTTSLWNNEKRKGGEIMSSHNTPNKKELDPLVVANYFLQLDSERVEPDVTQLKLHKIMYFAQANYLGATGSRLFSSHIEASPRGPIVLAICSDFKKIPQRNYRCGRFVFLGDAR